MIISFDLDDTLIPSTKRFDTEHQTLIQKICGIEKLRKGAVELMKNLQVQKHKIFIYTTSFRPKRKIWWMFFSYGINIDKVINQSTHKKILRSNYNNCSKYPPAFNIDIHIDDSKGVEIEGNRHNFKTIIVTEKNLGWAEFILQRIKS